MRNHPRAGIACAMKNAGVGPPTWGRCRITVEDGKIWLRAGASCIGQGLGTVLTQIACETLGVHQDVVGLSPGQDQRYPGRRYHLRLPVRPSSPVRACRRACLELKKVLDAGNSPRRS